MTALLVSLLCLISGIPSPTTGPTGVYRTSSAQAAAWEINDRHSLIWEGKPYLPVGLRISGTPEAIKAARDASIEDVIVELPANGSGWAEAFEALEKGHMRYLISISSLGPMAKGISVEPAGYRIDGITERQHVDLNLPGADSALAILATKRDAGIETVARIPTPDGNFLMDAKPMNDLEHVLLLYPEQSSLQQPDFWGEMDKHRDALIASLKSSPPGKGLRGIVNPIGTVVRLPSQSARFVPTNPYFQLELSGYLEAKYRNLQTAMKTWAMSSSDIDSFDKLARMVPLWWGSRGISELWDPGTDKLYVCDSKHSLVWRDIDDVISAASDRRFKRLVSSIRSVVNVPVIQDWAGWASPYEGTESALDGVGVKTEGTSAAALAEQASRGMSTVLRWRKGGWVPATRIDLGRAIGAETLLSGVLDDLTSMGTRGWFVKADEPALLRAVAAESARRSSNASLASESPKPIYYPESAMNPASAQRLPAGCWWLPSPAPGNRIDLGSHFFAYRILNRTGYNFALWTDGLPRRVKLRVVDPKPLVFTTLDGSDPKPKSSKTGLEIQLSESPLLISGSDEIPVPEPALLETQAQFENLSKMADTAQTDITEDRYFYKDSLSGFDRNPGGSFASMRLVIKKLSLRLAPFTWIEAESSPHTNFSEPINVPGCSGGGALSLSTALTRRNYFAEYNVSVRGGGDQEVWIAGRIPASLRTMVTIHIGGQTLTMSGDRVSPYGTDFAWYRFGVTRLVGSKTKVRIEITPGDRADFALDAIVFAPGDFKPNGVNVPELINRLPAKR